MVFAPCARAQALPHRLLSVTDLPSPPKDVLVATGTHFQLSPSSTTSVTLDVSVPIAVTMQSVPSLFHLAVTPL
ncbi:MAG: hypothetical protein KGM24_00340, partial [Elusimicrobia bacterium]|nr:hypothetical protein [Elusimicrobiota bacterium]